MNVFVTGANGYLGRALVKAGCKPLKCDDVTEYNCVSRAVEVSHPDLIIHLAGKSNPDFCQSNPDVSYKINIKGTYNIVENCAHRKIPLIYLSSSQIWGGGWWESIWNKHSEDSKRTPAVNSYGMQKVAAETIALWLNVNGTISSKIIRSSFVFDKVRLSKDISYLKHGISIETPTFLKRSFIHLDDFTYLISEYCKRFYEMPKVIHLAGSKTVSYYTFWLEVAKQMGFDKKLVRPRRVEKDYVDGERKTKRPHNGGLDITLSQRLGFRSFDYIGGIKRMKDES